MNGFVEVVIGFSPFIIGGIMLFVALIDELKRIKKEK